MNDWMHRFESPMAARAAQGIRRVYPGDRPFRVGDRVRVVTDCEIAGKLATVKDVNAINCDIWQIEGLDPYAVWLVWPDHIALVK